MRVRPVVTLAIAVLVLGACGSTAKSAAPEKPATGSKAATTTSMGDMPGMNHGTMAPTTPVTDLNGHEIVGEKAHDVMAEVAPDKPLDRAAHALLAQQLVVARATAMQYLTVAAATAGATTSLAAASVREAARTTSAGSPSGSIRATHSR